MMDTTDGGVLDKLRQNQTKFEEELKALKSNASDYQDPTMKEIDRLATILENVQTFNDVSSIQQNCYSRNGTEFHEFLFSSILDPRYNSTRCYHKGACS